MFKVMSPAEFRVLRESVGMTINGTARTLGVSERAVSYWDRGTRPVPAGVVEDVRRWIREADQLVDRCVESLAGVPGAVLVTFRDNEYDGEYPASWHRAVAARVAERVPGLRITY